MQGGRDLNALVGLEIHQQLASAHKLFCSCPITKSDELPFSFERRLRPSQSETGGMDPAAVFEFSKGMSNTYLWSPESACLVEADEEPPHSLDGEAMDVALQVALMLHSSVVDEVHVMRKIVIDGSNTSGFQRTAVVGLGGYIEVDGGRVGVQSVTLEEDAARLVGEDRGSRRYALDRQGVPLVEVALDPVAGDPEQVGRVALSLGRALRSTGRVARGLGTIRQDLNVSVRGGSVVEVKGVQQLNLLPKVVAYETARQLGLMAVAEQLKERGVARVGCTRHEVKETLAGTKAPVIQKALGDGGTAVCIAARGLHGLLGWEHSPGIRLGKEVAEVARANGLGGVIHSDEFARQGVSPEDEAALRRRCQVGDEAALVVVAGPALKVERTATQLASRLEQAARGVPAETRAATEDGETRYMRPRPGAARMYPETDIPEVVVGKVELERLSKATPEGWDASVSRLMKTYRLSEDLAAKVLDSDNSEGFEELARELRLEPSLIASTLIDLPARLAREGVPDVALRREVVVDLLRAIGSGAAAKEAAPEILRCIGSGRAKTVGDAVKALGLTSVSTGALSVVVEKVIQRNPGLVEERGMGAFAPLMGEVMAEVRGRADGRTVSSMLKDRLEAAVAERKRASGVSR